MKVTARARERRVTRRLEARGSMGLGQALVRLRGTQIDGRWELGSLYACGAEGAVFLCHDVWDATRPLHVAKIALLPYHRPAALSFGDVRARRKRLREEAKNLETSASRYMPRYEGLFEFENPLLDPERGGAFVETEPVLVMERLPGFDLDLWLARVHSSRVPRAIVRRNVDHVAVVVMRALWDLHERGFLYTDLRPGNIRIRGRSEHRVRLMDAGSLVRLGDNAPGFPHVPAYLPPELFTRSEELGPQVLVFSLEVQAVMAGRTLYEVATGRVPVPGMPVDTEILDCETVSRPVAETITRLCRGECPDVLHALKFLAKRSERGKNATRTINPADVAAAMKQAREQLAAANASEPPSVEPIAPAAPEPAPVTSEPKPQDLATALAAARASVVLAPPAPKRRPAPVAAPAPSPSPKKRADDEILPPLRPRLERMWAKVAKRSSELWQRAKSLLKR